MGGITVIFGHHSLPIPLEKDLSSSSASQTLTLAPSTLAAMSADGIAPERRDELTQAAGNGVRAGTAAGKKEAYGDRRLRLTPSTEHRPERYDDLQSELEPELFSALERHLPPSVISAPREDKFQIMREILSRYLPEGERARVQRHNSYRQRILSSYQPLHKELYTFNALAFFVPSFINAIRTNSEESFRSIISEPSPGIYSFDMLHPAFCEKLLDEVENFEKWVHDEKFKLMRPNTMNKYGAVLDDFGLEAMLNSVVEEFISPLSKAFFPEVGGSTLDSHHGFVVEYGRNKDLDLGFHVDDSEVTLNVCLGKQFSGGELYFRGVRCDQHINSEAFPEEVFDYSHVPGRAVLHRGRHRHGARPTTAGHRVNLLLWCRSSVFRELKKHQKDFSGWCAECLHERKERQRQSVVTTKMAFLRSADGSI